MERYEESIVVGSKVIAKVVVVGGLVELAGIVIGGLVKSVGISVDNFVNMVEKIFCIVIEWFESTAWIEAWGDI